MSYESQGQYYEFPSYGPLQQINQTYFLCERRTSTIIISSIRAVMAHTDYTIEWLM